MVYALGMAAVAVCAVTGALAAGRKRLDGIGVLFLAIVTALGGGTLRDVLLGSHPLFWIQDTNYLLVAVVFGVLTMATGRLWLRLERALVLGDALGLALFTAFGAQKAVELGSPPAVVIVMGVITGVAGGILRDLMVGEIAFVFLKGTLYASAALLATVLLVALLRFGVPLEPGLSACTILCLLLRLAAIQWNLTIPIFDLREKA